MTWTLAQPGFGFAVGRLLCSQPRSGPALVAFVNPAATVQPPHVDCT